MYFADRQAAIVVLLILIGVYALRSHSLFAVYQLDACSRIDEDFSLQ